MRRNPAGLQIATARVMAAANALASVKGLIHTNITRQIAKRKEGGGGSLLLALPPFSPFLLPLFLSLTRPRTAILQGLCATILLCRSKA